MPARAAEGEAFDQRIARQPIGAVQSAATRFAHGVQARQARPPCRIAIHAADHVVGRRVDGDQILRRVDLELLQQLGQLREARSERLGRQMPHIQIDVREIRLADLLDDRPAHDIARRPARRSHDSPS